MDLTIGQKVKHRLTGQKMMVLEIGPRLEQARAPGIGTMSEEYLAKGMVRMRLPDMKVVDVYEYEIEGMEPQMDTRTLLME